MEAEIVFLRDEIKNKNKIINNLLGNLSKQNKIINNLLGNLSKPQNLSYNDSNKTFSSSEEVLISHDNDNTMEPQEAVKRKQSTENRSNKSRLGKRDNPKRSQDNGIVIVDLENSTFTENVELQNISNIRNNLEKNNFDKDNIVILGDSIMKHVDGWKLSRLLKNKNKRVKRCISQEQQQPAWKVTSNQHSNEIQIKLSYILSPTT